MNVIVLSLCAGLFTYFFTALGASMVFFFKDENHKILDLTLAFAIGIMLSASFFSLLNPAIENIKTLNISILNIIVGFLSGGLFIYIIDYFISKKKDFDNKNLFLLFLSITMHNIPEGLVLGIAFGSMMDFVSAIMLTIAIALQNFPEGASISLPMRKAKESIKKSFFYGQISAIVEPIFSVIGACLVLKIKYILPFSLSFAAGAMIYVSICQLIPETLKNDKKNLLTLIILIGFTLMMILDLF